MLSSTLRLRLHTISFLGLIYLFLPQTSSSQDDSGQEIHLPPQVRMMRIYGGESETEPPIVVISSPSKAEPAFGKKFVTIEFDVDAPVSPNLYAKFVHCTFDWQEDENTFLSDITMNRTSLINWQTSPMLASYYNYRGKLKVPNEQVQFKYSGNWKVKLYEYYNDEVPVAEGRFFVVQPKAFCSVNVYSEFYLPNLKVAPTAFNIEASVSTDQPLFDSRLNTVVIYRNARWWEPYIITENRNTDIRENLYKYRFKRLIGGFASIDKRFRIDKIPTENEYRILNMTNTGEFPGTKSPIRLPFSDLRRTGSFWDRDDDGAMITSFVSNSTDDYINLEFVMDPDGWISDDDVFVVGSFNGWKPSPEWQMSYDPDSRYYTVRGMVRRARHNYMYATGKYNADTRQIEKLSYEEFEGNNSSNTHTFIALVYYREFDFGGYDALIGVGAGNTMGSITR